MALTLALPHHHRRSHFDWRSLVGTKKRRNFTGEIAIGVSALVAGGFLAYFLKERAQEELAHKTLQSEGAFSLRRYEPHIVAQVERFGSLTEAMDEGYRPLADYIGAKPAVRKRADDHRKIAMAVPVAVVPSNHAGSWLVRFAMPRKWSHGTLPEPDRGVTLRDVPERTVAAIRFAGRGTDRELVARKKRELLGWVERRGLKTVSQPEFAAYNAPIVPGLMRRNEWLVEVQAT